MIVLTSLAWFMVLILSERMPPLLIDMPSKATCDQIVELNSDKGARCWAKEKIGEAVEPDAKPKLEDDSF